MLCPLCAAAIPAGETTCPGCGAELTDYLSAKYQPDLLFNEALQCLRRESYSDASSLLCRAHALRPDDIGILDLWVRAEYASGNKKRALELLMDLVELDSSESRTEQLNLLVEEYDRDQADAGAVVKRELMEQNDRLHTLLNRLEQRLDQMENAFSARGDDAGNASKDHGSRPEDMGNKQEDSGDLPGPGPDVTAGEGIGPETDRTPPASGQSPEPAGTGSAGNPVDDFFNGGFPGFSSFSGMFPPLEDK